MIKSNPGKSNHSDCGAGGYINVASIPLKDIGVTATSQEAHRLRAKIDEKNGEFKLTVDVDENTIWSGDLDPKIIAPINGPVGFRSDNGSFIFKLFVADEKTK